MKTNKEAIKRKMLITAAISMVLTTVFLSLIFAFLIKKESNLENSESNMLSHDFYSAASSAASAYSSLSEFYSAESFSDMAIYGAEYIANLSILKSSAASIECVNISELCHYSYCGENTVMNILSKESDKITDEDKNTISWLLGYTSRLSSYFSKLFEDSDKSQEWDAFFYGYSYPGYESALFPISEIKKRELSDYEKKIIRDLKDMSERYLGRNIPTVRYVSYGDITCCRFECENAFCDISLNGQKLIRLAIEHNVAEQKLSELEAIDIALNFTNRNGCRCKVHSYDVYDGFINVTLVPENAIDDSQSVTVSVALDTGRVYRYCADKYFLSVPSRLSHG